MKTRKFFSLLPALIIAFILSACGNNEVVETSGSVTPSDDDPAVVTGTVSPDDSILDTPEENYSEKTGNFTGGIYENAYFGFGCEFDSSWTFYTDEELTELMGLTVDMITDDATAELLQSSGSTYDMYTYADDGLVTINVTIEDLGVIYGTVLSEESYAELAVDSAIDSLNSLEGVEVVSSSIESTNFAGNTHSSIRILSSYTVEDVSVDLYQLLVCVKNGNYMSAITFTSFFEDITDSLAADFYGISEDR